MSVCTNPNFVLVGIQQLRGANLRPNFDPLPPSSVQLWTFYILPTFCSRVQM